MQVQTCSLEHLQARVQRAGVQGLGTGQWVRGIKPGSL